MHTFFIEKFFKNIIKIIIIILINFNTFVDYIPIFIIYLLKFIMPIFITILIIMIIILFIIEIPLIIIFLRIWDLIAVNFSVNTNILIIISIFLLFFNISDFNFANGMHLYILMVSRRIISFQFF